MNIELNKTALGIEFGSTRIKAVLIDHNHTPLVSGEHEWEIINRWYLDIRSRRCVVRFTNGLWKISRRIRIKI
jgi:hypothetical protein